MAACIGLSLCASGGWILTHPDSRTAKTPGTISSVNCHDNELQKGHLICDAVATYQGTNKINVSYPPPLKNGDVKDIWYDPNHPESASGGQPAGKGIATGFIIVGFLVAIIGVLFAMWFSTLSNQGKAIVGGVEAASDVISFLRKN